MGVTNINVPTTLECLRLDNTALKTINGQPRDDLKQFTELKTLSLSFEYSSIEKVTDITVSSTLESLTLENVEKINGQPWYNLTQLKNLKELCVDVDDALRYSVYTGETGPKDLEDA